MKKLLIALILFTGGLYAQGDGPSTDQDKPLDPIERLRQAYNNQKRPKQEPGKAETVASTPQKHHSPSVDSIAKLRQAYAQKKPVPHLEEDKKKPHQLYATAKYLGKEFLINYIVLFSSAKLFNRQVTQKRLLVESALGLVRLRVPAAIEFLIRIVL